MGELQLAAQLGTAAIILFVGQRIQSQVLALGQRNIPPQAVTSIRLVAK